MGKEGKTGGHMNPIQEGDWSGGGPRESAKLGVGEDVPPSNGRTHEGEGEGDERGRGTDLRKKNREPYPGEGGTRMPR